MFSTILTNLDLLNVTSTIFFSNYTHLFNVNIVKLRCYYLYLHDTCFQYCFSFVSHLYQCVKFWFNCFYFSIKVVIVLYLLTKQCWHLFYHFVFNEFIVLCISQKHCILRLYYKFVKYPLILTVIFMFNLCKL